MKQRLSHDQRESVQLCTAISMSVVNLSILACVEAGRHYTTSRTMLQAQPVQELLKFQTKHDR